MTELQDRQLRAALKYWKMKTEDLTPENIAWLDATRERRLNMLNVIDEGLTRAGFWQDTAVIMIQLFHFMEWRGYWMSWIPTLEKAIKLCPDSGLYELARLQSQLSQLFRKSANFEDADQLYDQVLQYAIKTNNKELLISVYRDKAEGLIARNRLNQAEETILKAFKYSQNKESHEYAFLCETLANIYRFKGDYNKSLDSYKTAISIRKSLGEPFGFAGVLNDMGLVYDSMGEYKAALSLLDEALTILQDTDFQNLKFLITMNQGVAYYRQAKYEEAEKTFLKIDCFALKRSGDVLNYALTLNNIGNAKLKRGNYSEADPYLREAIVVFQSIGDEIRIANGLGTLAEILMFEKKIDQAKSYFDDAISLLNKYPENVWGQKLLKDFRQKRQACE